MPRLIPRLNLSRLPLTLPTPTRLSTTLSAVRPALAQPTYISQFTLSSSRPFLSLRTFTPSSTLFTTSPRSSILSRLSTPTLQNHVVQTQLRTLTYGTTYQPSQRKRKRKYGFLARLKEGKLGQAILARRRIRGRRFLSH